jgi:hypothetical protein
VPRTAAAIIMTASAIIAGRVLPGSRACCGCAGLAGLPGFVSVVVIADHPLFTSAWASATRSGKVVVRMTGGRMPPVPSAPFQVPVHVTVAVIV